MTRQVVCLIAVVVVLLAVSSIHAKARKGRGAGKPSAGALTAVADEKNANPEEAHSLAAAMAEHAEMLTDLSGDSLSAISAISALSAMSPVSRGIRLETTRSALAGGCVVFENQTVFEMAMQGTAENLEGVETFEEAVLPAANVDRCDDPLCGGIPNSPDGFPFPNGLDLLNLCVQSNALGGTPDVPSPHGVDGLVTMSAGFHGAVSDSVVAFFDVDSLDLIFDVELSHTAVGFNTLVFFGDPAVEIRVFSESNALLAASSSPANPAGSNFWGIRCEASIGRINIFEPGNGDEGADNIQLWTPEDVPCGNDVCEPEMGESCLSCAADCRACVCGNGEVEPGEACDPPGAPCAEAGQVCLSDCICGQSNDACEDAAPIFDGDTDFDTTGANTDGLPHFCCCQFDGQTYHDIWYDHIATCSGELTVSTCDQANYDTDLVVYDGCHPDDWTCPPGDVEMLGCNDDHGGCGGFTSLLTVPVVLDKCYTIRVGGWNDGDMGVGTLTLGCQITCGNGSCQANENCNDCPEDCGPCVCGDGDVDPGEECDPPGSSCPSGKVCRDDCTCPPPCEPNPGASVNDCCKDARPLFEGSTDFDTTGANTDGLPHEFCMFDGQTYNDNWFEHIALCSGLLIVNTCQSSYDTDLVVYDGCHPDDWICPPGDAEVLGCNDDCVCCAGFLSEVTVPVIRGNCYTVRIGGWMSSDMGPGVLDLHYYDCDFCGNGICDSDEDEDCESCAEDCGSCIFCGDGECLTGENPCNCPLDCAGLCLCSIFFDQASFEEFVLVEEGMELEGFESFEESILPPASADTFDDPLCGGIPNLPDGFPFPNGLSQLNLCVQSNILGGAPDVPKPRAANGLRAYSSGALGAVSDVVTSRVFVDSYDLIFTGSDHTGIGFNTLAFLGGTSVDIRVFDENQHLLVAAGSPASPTGINFFGVSCLERIGRINIFDPGGGIEGADNIQMWVTTPPLCGNGLCEPGEYCKCDEDCGPCHGICGDGELGPLEECDPPGYPSPQCSTHEACLPYCFCGNLCGDGFCTGEEDTGNCSQDCPGEGPCAMFTNQVEFEAYNKRQALILKGVETFEESLLPPATLDTVNDPLCGGVPNAPDAFPFPNGLDLLDLCVQSNIEHPPDSPNPRGADSLATASVGFLGVASDVVVASTYSDSLDLAFSGSQEYSGIGFNTLTLPEGYSAVIRIYDMGDDLLASVTSAADESGAYFFGVSCTQSIGRINVYSPTNRAEGADDIQMWVQGDPCGACPTDIDGDGDTGPFDLAFLLGFWGPCASGEVCTCLDADDDGLLGPADLAVLLAAWGPCE